MNNKVKTAIIAIAISNSLTACAGSGFIPDSQEPRPYVAAHDSINGECRDINLKQTTSHSMNRILPNHVGVVLCPQESGGVEEAAGVQSDNAN